MARKDNPKGAGPPTGGTGDVDLTTHPLVDKHHTDPDEVTGQPDVVSLIGYIGPSKRPDYTRLYQDLSFRNYYEIPTAGITATTPVNADDENSPTHVQVTADTKLDVVTVSVQSVEARFLSGSIASGFLGGAQAQTAGAFAPTLCTNITTYMPSCVAQQQPICLTVVTANPTDCGQQCNPNCIATIVTSGVGAQAQAVVGGGGQTLCANITTHMPSCVQTQFCITINTASPTNCDTFGGQLCLTLFTANPSNCGPGGGGGGPFCVTLFTANPTNCPPPCRVVHFTAVIFCTHNRPTLICTVLDPTVAAGAAAQQCNPNCVATIVTSGVGPQAQAAAVGGQTFCTNITTHMPSCVGQQAQAQVGTAPQFCITLHTHVPSFCPPHCQIIATTAATLCTQFHPTGPGTIICPTIYTAIPSGCEHVCQPIANTAATLCTQIHPTGPTATIA
jgi:hypothetical protein